MESVAQIVAPGTPYKFSTEGLKSISYLNDLPSPCVATLRRRRTSDIVEQVVVGRESTVVATMEMEDVDDLEMDVTSELHVWLSYQHGPLEWPDDGEEVPIIDYGTGPEDNEEEDE